MRLNTLLLLLTLGSASNLSAQSAPPTLATIIASQIADVRHGTTVADWLRQHPQDNFERSAWLLNPACGHITTTHLTRDSATAQIEVTFFPPPPPATLQLPRTTPPTALIDQCQAGETWVTLFDTDSARTASRQLTTESELSTRLGPGDSHTELGWSGSALWQHPTLRESDGVSLVVASTYKIAGDRNSSDSTRVFAAIVARRAGLVMSAGESTNQARLADVAMHHALSLDIDRAIVDAGMPRSVTAQLAPYRTVFETNPWDGPPMDSTLRKSFPTALGAWLAAARDLPPARRSAALFVVDEVLDESGQFGGWPNFEDSTLLHPLRGLGAVFVPDQLGAAFQYDHTWLQEAARIAPASRAGELAFLQLMRAGFQTNGACATKGATGNDAVIARGNAYLRQYPRTAIAPEIHRLMAAAYGEIITIAEGGSYGGDGGGADKREYGPQEEPARRHAMAEYVIALRTLRDPAERATAWSEAWRLLAGLAPTGMRYECVND